ncbi:glyceraldehyde dehydrogenase subunit beta [soil metagenome]
MIPAVFDYVRPADLDEALAILAERTDAKILAGGFSLLPLMKLRLAQPEVVIDLRDVGGLDGITESADELRIGGRATHRRIHEDALICASYPLLRDAAGDIGDPQIRNWGTLGGSVAHADPSADWPAVLIATHATIVMRDAHRERTVEARSFFIDSFETAIEPAEILTEVRIPKPVPRAGGAYAKIERRAGDFSTVGVAVQLSLTDDARISHIGIGITAVAPAAFAATDAEAMLTGGAPDDAIIRRAAEAAAAQSRPASDSHGPADYKRAMVVTMTIRAMARAIARAQGQD